MIWLLAGCVQSAAHSDSAAEIVCDGETGLEVGDRAQDVEMSDCAGAPVSLHGLCGQPAVVFNWYGWCPTCEDNADLGRRLADEHPELQVAVALDEDPVGEPVDAEFCDLYEGTYASRAAVWADPEGRLEVYGTTDLVLVLDAEGRITFLRNTATEAAIRDAVDAVLAE